MFSRAAGAVPVFIVPCETISQLIILPWHKISYRRNGEQPVQCEPEADAGIRRPATSFTGCARAASRNQYRNSCWKRRRLFEQIGRRVQLTLRARAPGYANEMLDLVRAAGRLRRCAGSSGVLKWAPSAPAVWHPPARRVHARLSGGAHQVHGGQPREIIGRWPRRIDLVIMGPPRARYHHRPRQASAVIIASRSPAHQEAAHRPRTWAREFSHP
jgi:hypothetical protein